MKIFASAACLLMLTGSAFAQLAPAPPGPVSANASGWVGGAQFGYNWQRGSLVYGFESDLSAMHLKSEITSPPANVFAAGLQPLFVAPLASPDNTNASIDWYGTVRARLAFAAGSFLFYGTGGLAYGKVDLSQTNSAIPAVTATPLNFVVANLQTSSQTSSTKVGWVAGGGIDYMLNRNLILNFAYQYVDLGSASLTSIPQGPFQPVGSNASVHAQFQVVTVGLSWRFSPPETAVASSQKPKSGPRQLPSNPWEGIYVGGHAGGAWGNETTATQPLFAVPN
ncbi:outer membrane beta-barrel protein [Bradyrhizobium sediminis]|uniref:Outer membrane beta-barrel protein n=1 Tax=Bradyrhizobium sediminis TaxID=2840469 RepID=A0A975RQR9_9BRAD|nr:outer membrane beta-barrel protein [Bradyrhizobium sediminis]QWG16815.1 outer membrane beta-barrel protein [Bradyrhizobium sediminis]